MIQTVGLYAQQYELAGQVTYHQEPVQGASVSISPEGIKTQTDKAGRFSFLLNQGKHFLQVSYKDKHLEKEIILEKDIFLQVDLAEIPERLEEVIITAVRVGEKTPVTKTVLKKEEIEEKYVVQDVPYLLSDLPSVVTWSDAGAGVGYTGLRIRGIGPQQINVTLNGIPLNDPESQSVYWVDIPDFIFNTTSVEVQRGVGTSTYGTGAFGANINLQTDPVSEKPYAWLSGGIGSFNTKRIAMKASTGLLPSGFEFMGRVSKIKSDGYIDRAFSNMDSYYLSGTYKNQNHLLKLITFGGHEKTYQAWYGVDKATFESDPTFNYAGAIYDDNWNIIRFYDNEVDDYTQKHYQLHYSTRWNSSLSTTVALHYTKGYGYYEQYKQHQDFSKYGFIPITIGSQTVDTTDLIRRKWLDNDFYGIVANIIYKTPGMKWIFGAAANRYIGDHFGEVIWARFADNSEIRHRYYDNTGIKNTVNFFLKNHYQLGKHFTLYTDVQLKNIDYNVNYNPDKTFDPDERVQVSDKLFFVNPKIGLYYKPSSKHSAYFSIAQAHREPNRTDYVENFTKPKPEKLTDFELGYQYHQNNLQWETTLYYMYYQDQLVYTGRIDNVGNPIRENVGKSYRTGWENKLHYVYQPFELTSNFTLSENRNINYQAFDSNGQLQNYGNTVISFSPSLIAGATVFYQPLKNIKIGWQIKHIGRQYMDNRNISSSVLPAYTLNHLIFAVKSSIFAKEMMFKLQVRNLFNEKYAANGYMWGDDPYYYPQAGRYYLVGWDVRF